MNLYGRKMECLLPLAAWCSVGLGEVVEALVEGDAVLELSMNVTVFRSSFLLAEEVSDWSSLSWLCFELSFSDVGLPSAAS